MKFSWKALLLAPLAIPVVMGMVGAIGLPNGGPLAGFLFFFVASALLSYGSTLFLLLPAVYLLSRLTAATFGRICGLGALLGVAIFLVVARVDYQASGDNSGPPEGTFASYLAANAFSLGTWLFPLSGLGTAALYAALSARTQKSTDAVRDARAGRTSPTRRES